MVAPLTPQTSVWKGNSRRCQLRRRNNFYKNWRYTKREGVSLPQSVRESREGQDSVLHRCYRGVSGRQTETPGKQEGASATLSGAEILLFDAFKAETRLSGYEFWAHSRRVWAMKQLLDAGDRLPSWSHLLSSQEGWSRGLQNEDMISSAQSAITSGI